MSLNRTALFAAFALSLALGVGASPAGLCGDKLLKGSVRETGVGNQTPTLKRQDIDRNADPFSGPEDDEGEALDAPQAAFKSQSPMVPPKQPKQQTAFDLRANEQGNPFNGQNARPVIQPPDMDGAAAPLPPTPPPPRIDPNDPDTSPELQLAWDMWHKQVAATIFDRFNFFARAAFRRSPPLMARVSYSVTRDGQITNMNMQVKSTNVLFNVLVFQAIKSLNGDMSVLAFPQGSRRMSVAKLGTFTQNYGQEGFRYTVGDSERVAPQQQQQRR